MEETVTHPEATVSGSISCGLAGSSGWCRGGAELSLSGSEPLAGYAILALEGTRNGETFACPGSSCSVPLLEGINDFTFWALSSWGDSSRMGTASGRLDSGAPVISGEVTGTAGEAGWHISEVAVSASAADAVSGLLGFAVSLDRGGWSAYAGPITVADGEHTVELRASDAAGNVATESLEARVDTQPPNLNLTAGGSFCPGCGETADITLDVQDGGSGVAAWNLTAEGNAIASGTGPTSESFAWEGSGLGAGTHTLTLSARDIAGNAAERSVTVQLVAPTAVPPTEQSSNPAPQGMVVPSAPTATRAPIPSGTPAATRTPFTSSFGGLPAMPLSGEGGLPDEPEAAPETVPAASAQGSSSGVLWGGAAVALIGAATAAALEAARRRKDEEARLKAEMAGKNAEAERREEEEARRQAGLARAAALAAAAVEAARRRRDQLFEDRELRGEVEETGSAG
ncbi:MAG: Ig-like domain-containing protein, partial [Chloroflexota bacterium]